MQSKIKKRLFATVGVLAICTLMIGIAVGCLYSFNRPSVTFDFSQKTGPVTNGASGFLYGFAEPDIPSREIAESIGVSTLSTKAYGGLQHPVGDVNQVADTFLQAGGKQIIVYTQDMYDTWYYQFDSLEQYHERVRQTVTETAKTDYADKVVYCIYNEMDNGEWFGDFSKHENRVKTYEAWKATYTLVRSIDPNAKIGGPGYKRYDSDDIKEFLEYCKAENCLPDTMIWHELGTNSLYMFEDHFADYDKLCTELQIGKMPVCISEYGLMETNGIPGESVKWISRIENAKAEGCVAYWRLANNLSDVASDDVTPNSNWWAYHWYANMTGQTVSSESKDLFQSNMGKFLTFRSKGLKYKGFTGLSTIDEEKGEIQILAGGSNRDSDIVLENLDATEAFKNAKSVWVTAEYVDYKGLGGSVARSKEAFRRILPVENGRVKIELNDILYTQCYRLTVMPMDVDYENRVSLSTVPYEKNANTAMRRYEAEDAKLFGTAKINENAPYAASEGKMVYLNSAEESGVEFTIDIPEYGFYYLDLVYGNGANDVQYADDGTIADKGERTAVDVQISIDGEQLLSEWSLPSTIKDDYTDYVRISALEELAPGKHTIRVTLAENTAVNQTLSFDCLDVTHQDEVNLETYHEHILSPAKKYFESETAFWILSQTNGYTNCSFQSNTPPTALALNGTVLENVPFEQKKNDLYECTVYLRKGINYISVNTKDVECMECYWFDDGENDNITDYFTEDFILTGSAKLVTSDTQGEYRASEITLLHNYISGITSDTDGTASVRYTAPQAGYYNLLFFYTNNEEGGAHDYNVDLIEEYLTLSVNGKKQGNYYFRNTYSWENLNIKSVTVYLEAGENLLTVSNDGSYKFNGQTMSAPRISRVVVSPTVIKSY